MWSPLEKIGLDPYGLAVLISEFEAENDNFTGRIYKLLTSSLYSLDTKWILMTDSVY